MKLQALRYLLGMCLLLCVIVGCDPYKADLPTIPAANASVSFYNLVPYQGAINLYSNGTRQNSSKLNYGDFSGYFSSLASGDQIISFKTDSLHDEIYAAPTTLTTVKTTLFVTGKSKDITVIRTIDTAVTDTKNIKPKLRFIHASADAPALDLTVNSVTIGNQAYRSVSAFSRVDTGKVTITVKKTGTSVIVYNGTAKLVSSGIYTMYVYGSLAGGSNSITLGGRVGY